jgi:hypothetical protein
LERVDSMNQETIVLNPQVAWREIEGRVVVISPVDSVVHELNETASFIWKHADRGHKTNEIMQLLTEEFGVDQAQAKVDMAEFVALLQQKGLVVN